MYISKPKTNLCKCGCNELVESNYKRGHARRGMKNSKKHNLAISKKNKGKPMSEYVKQKLIEANKNRIYSDEYRKYLSLKAKQLGYGKWMTGKKIPRETVEKIINTRKNNGVKCSEETKIKIGNANRGENNGMYGHVPTKEEREFLSKHLKSLWDNPETRQKLMKNKKEITRLGALAAFDVLKNKGKSNTKPELQMKQILHNLNIHYEHSKKILDIEHIYCCDFYLPHHKTIIETDGIYWHNYPHGRPIDHIRNKELLEAGYKIFRFWEGQFDENSVKEKLLQGGIL